MPQNQNAQSVIQEPRVLTDSLTLPSSNSAVQNNSLNQVVPTQQEPKQITPAKFPKSGIGPDPEKGPL